MTKHISISLLKAIILFNPNRPNLSHKLNVKLEQQLYIYLLQRYLLLKCRSKPESQTMLQKLMTMLMDVHFVSELELTHVPMYKELTDYNGINELERNRIRELMSASNLTAIVLFNPNRPHLTHRHNVKTLL
ncbi:unnamed protein product [Oppiella nova]|uniref:Uncharacterized protein n=1 Tax=Oppiella nova TaxID=334625 RepID=A0A7R9M1I6_9ACAR|nr:unnamed protein product [Oppiella nova]CAG2168784.1 unnamed protein product [Oppiella nova]